MIFFFVIFTVQECHTFIYLLFGSCNIKEILNFYDSFLFFMLDYHTLYFIGEIL